MKIYRYPALLLLALILIVPAAAAKDQWTQVRSKNFFLIGNASEKDIKRVGTRLEQFRESFRRLFSGANLTSSIPTNVVVFKNSSSYKPFKPKRSDGKADTFIAGYFQAGDDVNYITLAADGDETETFGIIFHEYVHSIINTNFGKSRVPQWFNEGLAEYYQTVEISEDIKIKLGLPQLGHLRLLQQSQLMPLDMLFNATNEQIHSTGGHSRSIFYAQSWALVHFLNQTGRGDALAAFLKSVTEGAAPREAFTRAFKTDYNKMELDLKRYVAQGSFKYADIKFKEKLGVDAEMVASPLGDAVANAYLGDLLYHTHRIADAEPYLAEALKLEPASSMALTTLGMVKLRLGKYDEARAALERALAGDPKNHIAYYQYAFLLSREGRDEFGYVQGFDSEKAEKMRVALRRAIALNPRFTESHELLAFVSLVNNDQHDEAVKYLRDALTIQPGNERYRLRLAEIYSRQSKFDEAAALAESIAKASDDAEAKGRAGSLLTTIRQMRQHAQRLAAAQNRAESTAGGGAPRLRHLEGGKRPTEAEMARMQHDAKIRSINEVLRTVSEGERRLVGRIEKIDCKKRPIAFTFKSDKESLTLTTKDFASLTLTSLDGDTSNVNVGCDADLSKFNTVVTYSTEAAGAGLPSGSIIALEFVPADFRVMSDEEMKAAAVVVYDDEERSQPENSTAGRREAMYGAIRNSLHKPVAGERQELGFLDKVECSGGKVFFHVRTNAAQTLKLINTSPQSLKVVFYTGEAPPGQFGCGMRALDQPAVITYSALADAKMKTAGEIIALEFVPRGYLHVQQ
ncbi:MAG: tetratricopeptide repeat protein [Pyrinomonadaceae bacterium]